ncbi:hypothetical protein COT44_03100 [Candidatus Shapirobacteria bacterium CG08_land_8_20_14_0_20_39_18]|uniref:TNase-like domain-containing protein n=1 Tax=Candidatus Shapirobacteria bacterium CG08_land_8_20_14_0_20_39_18 TaxID=1974883 RepID=A0A2M6XCJ9_9BACT|nr:MAG: hypothetical protein COT44_03100 [Candidatus Shapirobacteria bacterium CG08_land_8_20_14_0_20_39_18]
MKKLGKILLIFFVAILSLVFFPIAIGIGVGFLVHKRTTGPRLKYFLLTVIALLTLFFGSAWVEALNSPTKPESASPTPVVEGIKTELNPTLILTAVPTGIPSSTPIPVSDRQEARVTRVIDGDTIDVLFNGKTERIRFIGINTPETVDPRKPVECFGKEAYRVTNENLMGQMVLLESDSSQTNRDKYNRLLRYVWKDNGTVDFGKVLIATGYAYEYTYDVPYKYQKEYKQAQKEAEEGKKGLWADDACPTSTPTTSISTGAGNAPAQLGNSGSYTCDCGKSCTEISSCAEAQYLLNVCGCKQRDADKDGIACDGAPLKCQN